MRAPSLFGPYDAAPLMHTPVWNDAISRQCAEGPTLVMPPQGGWLLLYDGYRTDCVLHWSWEQVTHGACMLRSGLELIGFDEHECQYRGTGGFGALYSHDLRTWRDVSTESHGLRIPRTHKHGTALQLRRAALCTICEVADADGAEASIAKSVWQHVGILQRCDTACRQVA